MPFCKVSMRGWEAQRFLDGEGFANVRFMEGGLVGWPYALDLGENEFSSLILGGLRGAVKVFGICRDLLAWHCVPA